MVQLDVGGTSPWYKAVTAWFMFSFGSLLFLYPFSKCTRENHSIPCDSLRALFTVLLSTTEFTSIHLTVTACNLHENTWGHLVVI